MPDEYGRTHRDEALRLLEQAETDLKTARALVSTKPTRESRLEAFKLLSGVEASCATLKIAIDPW
jgi:hypothetical protein